MRVVMVGGTPMFRYHKDDKAAEALFIAQAQELGIARPGELSERLEPSPSKVYRIRQRYLAEGAEGLIPKKRGPKGPRLGQAREDAIRRWHREDKSAYWMAKRLRVDQKTVRSALKRMGLPTRKVVWRQNELEGLEEESAEAGTGGDEQEAGDDEAEVAPEAGPDEGDEQEAKSQAVRVVQEAKWTPATEGKSAGVPTDRGAGQESEDESEVVFEPVSSAAGSEREASEGEAEGVPESVPTLGAGAVMGLPIGEQPVAALAVATTLDVDPSDRAIDRMLAAKGRWCLTEAVGARSCSGGWTVRASTS